jgi:L-amino acid N-acyltransferase YncA
MGNMKIRKAVKSDASGIARVHVDSWKTTYKGIVSDTYLNQLSYERREKMWAGYFQQDQPAGCLYVAENDGGEIIGFATAGPERSQKFGYDSELYAIYILQEYQRQHLGSRLIKTVVKDLVEQGFQSMLVWVLEQNPSRKFYESLKPEFVAEEMIQIGDEFYNEVAYGWKRIEVLL